MEIRNKDEEINEEYENNLPFDSGYRKQKIEYDEETEKQIESLKERLQTIKEPNRCYILIQYDNGQACIKEILSKKIVLGIFDIKDYELVSNAFWTDDCIVKFHNINKKSISLFSLKKGYIFSPHTYKKLENYELGVIVDEKYVIEFRGYVMDITNYERIEGKHYRGNVRYDVYFNKESEKCYITLDLYCLLHGMEKVETGPNTDENKNIFELKLGMNKYTFNADTKDLIIDEYYEQDDWTDEDAWDAMTDGMYGDYPGSGWDPERFGF